MAPPRTSTNPTTSTSAAASKPPIDTGFPEPFSDERNTTLRHPAAIPAASSDNPATIDTSLIANEKSRRLRFSGKHRKLHRNGTGLILDDDEDAMYRGMEERSAEEVDGTGVHGDGKAAGKRGRGRHEHQGKVKKALHRLSCGSV